VKPLPHEILHREARAADGVKIVFTWWRRPSRELLVIAPGFWRVRLAPANLFLANHYLRRGYDVVVLDFRGHGDSRGGYTFGLSEPLDLRAVLEELVGPERPYRRFALLGLSLGGSIAAVTLQRFPHLPCRALAMVSSPADFLKVRPRPWRPGALRQLRLRQVLRIPRLAAGKLLGERPIAAEAVSRLTLPKLVVTAEGDWLVDPSHGRLLASAAAPPIEYVHLTLPGSLHADALVRFVPLRLFRVLDRWLLQNAPP
jgi:pimeloyl-ACP methyl ester carboxylesterase